MTVSLVCLLREATSKAENRQDDRMNRIKPHHVIPAEAGIQAAFDPRGPRGKALFSHPVNPVNPVCPGI
jgi:hypothetical protein